MRARVLTFRYVGALLVVAGLLVAGQTVIHQLLARQEGDARAINLAGRQRMLGQRLCTLALALAVDTGDAARATRDELARTADDWERNHSALRTGRPELGLRGGNSEPVLALFAQIDPDHRAMLAAARAAAALPIGQADPGYARIVRHHQNMFLAGMDRIVTEYEREAQLRIVGLRRLELVLLAFALLVLALDGLFVFRPAMSELRTQLAERDLVHRAFDTVGPGVELAAAPDAGALARLEHQLVDVSDRAQIRLAQDLHDGLGQHLIGVAYLLRPLRGELSGSAAARIGEVERLVAEAIDQTRDLVRGLHSRTLELAGLTAALDELAGQVARVFGVACRVRDRAGVEPALAVRGHLHRIAREAAVNAAKHAGATAIEIELACDAGALRLVVRDDGVGIPERPRDGMGLHLMAYRARMLGASLDIAAGWPRGTTVTCRLPLDAVALEGPA